MSNPFVPIETATIDWRNNTPFSVTFADVYFSKENGLREAEHVFIVGNQLIERWQNLTNETFVIGETGFGTGLNFLLTWFLWLKHAPQTANLHFISCEKFPLTKEQLFSCLKQWPQLENQIKLLWKSYPVLTPGFHHLEFENGRVSLTLMLGEATSCYKQLLECGENKLEQILRKKQVDAWFLDGFSPATNQAMWSQELFHLLALLSKEGTTLATFSAAGLVKTNLKTAGFTVQKIKGFGTKHEMVVAEFLENKENKRSLRQTPWHCGEKSHFSKKKAIVLGAGLAGCYTAHALAKRGWHVTLIDENSSLGQGASGNRQAVLYPKLSAYRSPLTDFMLTSFLFAHRAYQQLLDQHPIGDLSGILQFAFNEKELASHNNLHQWLAAYPELGVLVDAQQASSIAGVELRQGGLFIPRSGWLDSRALCRCLTAVPGIEWVPNTAVSEFHFDQSLWQVNQFSAPVLVLANGYKTKQFLQTAHLPLKVIRGQMTRLKSTISSLNLKVPLCGDGHVLPAYQGMHAVGASYHLGSVDTTNHVVDECDNLAKLAKIPANIAWSNEVKENWTGIRTAAPDYLPLVGPAPDPDLFMERFAALASDSKRWIPHQGTFFPGLFVCTGFGSRGLTTIPLSAEWLAALINQEFGFIPNSMARALSPARFLFKKIIKT